MNKSIEKLYEKSPIWFQNWMISLYGAKLAHLRYGNEYHVFLDYLKQRDVSNPQVQKRIQNQLFLDFLHYAVKNSPFYQDFYKDVDLNQIKSVEDITKLPILTKEILRQNIKKIYTINPKDGVVSHTGGTTGKSLQVFFTKQDTQRKLAYLDWFKSLHGFTMTQQRHARFNGKHIVPANQKSKIFWRDNKIIKQRIYSSFFTSEDNIPYYIENLNKYKPEEIDGFVSTMYEIARYMERHGIQPTFSPIAIFPTSETVLPMHRELLSRVFRCPIRDQYASSEGAPFIIEDELGYMHECIDTGVFEHIPSQGRKKHLIVTSFFTHGTPLIRYDIGDDIIEAENEYINEGSLKGFPCVAAIDGRKADFLYSPERGIISVANLSNVIKYLPNAIVNIQYIQESEQLIRIKLVVDQSIYHDDMHKSILDEMRNRFGQKMSFNIEIVDEIPRAKSGKYQMIINKYQK